MLSLAYPAIDPIAIQIGPLAIHWYALAYIAGLLIGWRYILGYINKPPYVMTRAQVDDLLFWATLGVILGGRTGYVLFYNFDFYAAHPIDILKVWQGGMSFHGGMLGVIIAVFAFARHRGISFLGVIDAVAAAAPIGLFFGRIANFINGELFGRVTDVPWAMVFPRGGPEPRHPSQLYEAGMEGIILFLILLSLSRKESLRSRPGVVGGTFLAGYGICRIIGEFFRQPDAQLGYLEFGATMGQLLSIPMVLVGIGVVIYALKHPPLVAKPQQTETDGKTA
jgi:phosphatidylglycerol:prolipoprotein diacylglycerol transferase